VTWGITIRSNGDASDLSVCCEGSPFSTLTHVPPGVLCVHLCRYLSRLLLLHGRWNYMRNKEVVLYSFYKNWAYVLVYVYLQFVAGGSGCRVGSGCACGLSGLSRHVIACLAMLSLASATGRVAYTMAP
jgi:hypothetical protein